MWDRKHCVSDINYHIVFCTKYRLNFLKWKFEFVEKILKETSEKYWWEISDLWIDEDHVHILINCQPVYSPSEVIKLLKQHLAFYLVKEYDDIREKYLWWTKQIFSHWYFVSTVWKISKTTLKEYLKHHEQEWKDS